MRKKPEEEPSRKRKRSVKVGPEVKQLRKEMRRSKTNRIESVMNPDFEYPFISVFEEEVLLNLIPGRVLQWVVSVDDISPGEYSEVRKYFTREATVSPKDLELDLEQGLITFRDTQKKQWHTVRTAKVFGIKV